MKAEIVGLQAARYLVAFSSAQGIRAWRATLEGCLKSNPTRRNLTRPEMRVTEDYNTHAHRTVSRKFLYLYMMLGDQ